MSRLRQGLTASIIVPGLCLAAYVVGQPISAAGNHARSRGKEKSPPATHEAPHCTELKLPVERRLVVKLGAAIIEFAGGDFSSEHDPTERVHSFEFESANGKYLLELNIMYDFHGRCPITFDLPTTEVAASLYLYEVDSKGKVTAIADSDESGASGKLTIDGYVVTGGSEEASFSCADCVLPPKAQARLKASISGQAHDGT